MDTGYSQHATELAVAHELCEAKGQRNGDSPLDEEVQLLQLLDSPVAGAIWRATSSPLKPYEPNSLGVE